MNLGHFQERSDDTSNARWQARVCEAIDQGVCGHSQISEEQLPGALPGGPSKNIAIKLLIMFFKTFANLVNNIF